MATVDITSLTGTETPTPTPTTTPQAPLHRVREVRLQQGLSLRVAPNPVREQLVISVDGASRSARLRLYNSAGQLVLVDRMSASRHQLDVAALPSGIYLLLVADHQSTISTRVLVE